MGSQRVRHDWTTFPFPIFTTSSEIFLEHKNWGQRRWVYYRKHLMLLSIHIWDLIELSRRSWFLFAWTLIVWPLNHKEWSLTTLTLSCCDGWACVGTAVGSSTVPSRGVCENAFNGLQSTVICAPRLRPQTYWSRDKPISLYPVQNLDWPNAWA